MRKDRVPLDSLKQQQVFWYKHGMFSVMNKNHTDGIEFRLVEGSYKKLKENETAVLPRKTPVSTKPIKTDYRFEGIVVLA